MNKCQIYTGDCLEVLKGLPDNSIHCCITSPPYFGLRDYNAKPSVWGGEADCEHEWGPMGQGHHPGQVEQTKWKTAEAAGKGGNSGSGQFCLKCEAWLGSLGLEPTPALYIEHLTQIFRQVRRVLHKTGTFWLNLGDSYVSHKPREKATHRQSDGYGDQSHAFVAAQKVVDLRGKLGLKDKDLIGIPWRVAFALRDDGWWLRSDIIWNKVNAMPESVNDRPTHAHEYIFLLTKASKYYYDIEVTREPHTEISLRRIEYGLKHRHPEGIGVGIPPVDTDRMGERFCNPAGRNKRDVWTVAGSQFKGAHFAVYSTKLIEPCMKAGTSEMGCCSKCSAPWRRVIDRQSNYEKREPAHIPNNTESKVDSTGWKPPTITQNGWEPTCDCNADLVPCTVLDPFFGSGTTGLLAASLKRDCIGIDLNPEYVELARKRLETEIGLFVEIEAK